MEDTYPLIRRLRAALTALMLLSALAPSIAVAAPTSSEPASLIATSHTGCVGITGANRHVGFPDTASNGNITGVVGNIRVAANAYFRPCTTQNGNDGAWAWISVEPTNPANIDQLIQIGITYCNNVIYSVCNFTGVQQPRLFWAAGGCGGAIAIPHDLGQAGSSTTYSFRIQLIDGVWKMYVNSVYRVGVSASDPGVSCWTGGSRRAGFWGETWDAGDVLGRINYGRTKFTQLQVRGSSWQQATGSENCYSSGPSNSTHPLACDGYNNGTDNESMWVWSSGW